MATLIELGIASGQWIITHTPVPYPVQTTIGLALVCGVLTVASSVRLAVVSNERIPK
jgi:hypothetical protein